MISINPANSYVKVKHLQIVIAITLMMQMQKLKADLDAMFPMWISTVALQKNQWISSLH
jgi:hypothetical protein